MKKEMMSLSGQVRIAGFKFADDLANLFGDTLLRSVLFTVKL
jgi:hypothetical protein|tara:strand:+ start:2425 stop:2550 length:126 start_codon:yes stop_codon:yes gene_type:complete